MRSFNRIQRASHLEQASTSLYVLIFIVGLLYASNANAEQRGDGPETRFYVGLTESCCGEDPHPVHGSATPDGGVVVVGKTLTANDGWGGFAVKVGAPLPSTQGTLLQPGEDQSLRWVVRHGEPGQKSALLNVTAIEDAVFLAGMRTGPSGSTDMYLAKHRNENGELIWQRTFASPRPGLHGAIEALHLTPDGGLVAVGVTNAPLDGLEGFKSFGNPVAGQAHAFALTPEQVGASTPPETPQWRRTFQEYETLKAVRPVPSGGGGFIVLAGREEASPALIRLDPRGESEWSREYPGRFEATDVALHIIDGEHRGYTFTGHGGDDGTLDGQLTRVNLDGEQVWSRAFGNPTGGTGIFAGLGAGEPQLIYDECWGIQGLADGGVVVACGTGIEGCDVASSNARLRAACQNDPRRVWRGYLVRFDATGEVVWERVDSFTEAGAADDVADAASEYVIQLHDGGFVSIVDQGFGIGLLGLGPDTQEPPADMGGDADISMNEDTAPDDPEASEPGNEMPEAEDDDRESPEDAFEADDVEDGDDSETDRTEDDSAYEADDERGGEDESEDISLGCTTTNTQQGTGFIWLLALLCVRRLRFL